MRIFIASPSSLFTVQARFLHPFFFHYFALLFPILALGIFQCRRRYVTQRTFLIYECPRCPHYFVKQSWKFFDANWNVALYTSSVQCFSDRTVIRIENFHHHHRRHNRHILLRIFSLDIVYVFARLCTRVLQWTRSRHSRLCVSGKQRKKTLEVGFFFYSSRKRDKAVVQVNRNHRSNL